MSENRLKLSELESYERDLQSLDNAISKFKFIIPIYQRPYEWREEVRVLLEDLYDVVIKGQRPYFVGTIVGEIKGRDNGKFILEVVDGQQRLISFYLIYQSLNFKCKEESEPITNVRWCEGFEVEYEIRETSNKVLKNFGDYLGKKDLKEFAGAFYEIEKFFNEKKGNEKKADIKKRFCEICNRVFFSFLFLPPQIDVAKYFEDMNARSEQLEHHEVVKARLLEKIKDENIRGKLSHLWDLASFMNAYIEDLIYYEKRSDSKENIRTKLFEFIDKLRGFKIGEKEEENSDSKNLGEILNIISYDADKGNLKNEDGEPNLKKILEGNQDNNKGNSKEKSFYIPGKEEVRSIVSFPVFLLHTLKIFLTIKKGKSDTSLNDKNLIEEFKKSEIMNNENDVYMFILFLFGMRILFDYFVFKREIKNEEPYFKLFDSNNKFNDGNNWHAVLMIQLLFNYTSFNRYQQNWLSVVLLWLYCCGLKYVENKEGREKKQDSFHILCSVFQDDNDDFGAKYLEFLENFDRRVAIWRLEKREEESLIDTLLSKKCEFNWETVSMEPNNEDLCKLQRVLNMGANAPHYWFYRLEYKLWRKIMKNETEKFHNCNHGDTLKDIKKVNYRLVNLNSIEHVYPQNPANPDDSWKCKEKKNGDADLQCCFENCGGKCCKDCFGNLALVSEYMNSRYGNDLPETKKPIFERQKEKGTIESLKLYLIYECYMTNGRWTHDLCCEHHRNMVNVLFEDILP